MPANQKQASEAPQQLWGFHYFAWLKLVLPHGAGAFWQRFPAPATHAELWSAGGVWVSVSELYKQLEVCLSELSVVFGRVRSGLGARLAAVVLVGHQWGVGSVPVLAGVLGLWRGKCLASPGVLLCAAASPWVCVGF